MNIVVLRSALDDIARGYGFYEQQEAGLGAHYEDSILSEIESLRITGGIHRITYGYHRLLAHRFPYAIYYELYDNTISQKE